MKRSHLKQSQFDLLVSIVEAHFGFKILVRHRGRNVIDARMILYRVLYDMGYGVAEIGRFADKNHATIINAIQNFENYIEVDLELRETYAKIKDKFYAQDSQVNPLLYKPKHVILEKALSLEQENSNLISLLAESKRLMNKYEKYDRLIQILDKENPDREQIAFIERKLNHILNGQYEI